MEQLARLRAPFPLEAVGFKPQVMKKDKSAAMAATYIDARAVAERLDEVFPLAWTNEYEVMEHVENRLTIECRLSIIVNGQKITRSDVGESTNSDDERSASRWKSATSDAFKRAAVKFGVGAYLYALPQVWADYDADKRRFAPAGLKKLEQGYAQAVKRLGLSEPGERSQDTAEAHPEPEEANESFLSNKEASSLHASLGKAGISGQKAQLSHASDALGREITSFTQIRREEVEDVLTLASVIEEREGLSEEQVNSFVGFMKTQGVKDPLLYVRNKMGFKVSSLEELSVEQSREAMRDARGRKAA